MDRRRHPRYRDREDSRFYQALGLSPEETWHAGILRVHPFVDGNHRVGFVALSAALWSFGLPNVRFIGAEEMIAHDDALVPALLSASGDVEPFARLLAMRIEHASSDPT